MLVGVWSRTRLQGCVRQFQEVAATACPLTPDRWHLRVLRGGRECQGGAILGQAHRQAAAPGVYV